MDEKLSKIDLLLNNLVSYKKLRQNNKESLQRLYHKLHIDQKLDSFDELFSFTALNVTGFSLQPENFLESYPNRYVQIIAIQKSRNINLRYFGRSEHLEEEIKKEIAEFILRWRLEKSFRNVDYYKELVQRVENAK